MTYSRMTDKRLTVDVGEKLGAYNNIDLMHQEGRGVEGNSLMCPVFVTSRNDEVIKFVKGQFSTTGFGVDEGYGEVIAIVITVTMVVVVFFISH